MALTLTSLRFYGFLTLIHMTLELGDLSGQGLDGSVSSPFSGIGFPGSPRLRENHLTNDKIVNILGNMSTWKTINYINNIIQSIFMPSILVAIEEGNPSKRELGESSASLPKILSVTGEPIHHTIPLLATRIARHEDRLNDIVSVINGLPCGHITEDVNNLIIGQMAVESKVEQIKTEFSESMEFIAALCSANVTMGDVLTSFDHELEQISAQNFSLRRAIQESYARERTRDRTIETLTTKITELQRHMDEVSGKP
ncbi:hypothetical protein CTI12_AA180180 [Artemisia annua]|uniref:Uncharacterized protein n=1 Tax=Artemisia annua TaxID=35608 RepID=A0A2U1P8Y6_ARTAN|nr:hypothetical protein CTI12_AA180180 [Artemisia annua]